MRIPHVKLEAAGWCIEITASSNTRDTSRAKQLDREYTFTHNGIITRMDDTTFAPGDVNPILEALRLFLSFARGNYCSLALEVWPESGVGRPAAILGVNKHSEG